MRFFECCGRAVDTSGDWHYPICTACHRECLGVSCANPRCRNPLPNKARHTHKEHPDRFYCWNCAVTINRQQRHKYPDGLIAIDR